MAEGTVLTTRPYADDQMMEKVNTISGVREGIATKKVSAREIAADYFKRIAVRNRELNAYLTLSEERAYKQADRVDAQVAAGKPLGPLAGVPIAG